MWDLIAKMFFCLLLAFLLGLLIGWLLGRLGIKRKEEELRAEWEGRLKGCEGKLSGLNADLTAARQKNATMEADANAASGHAARIADLEAQLAVSGDAAARLAESDAKLSALNLQLGDCQQKVSSLNLELTAAREAPASSAPGLAAASLLGAGATATVTGGGDDAEIARLQAEVEMLHAKLRVYASGRLPGALDAAPSDPDNLEDINGVGPVLAKMLNDMGIYYFRQVANWTGDDIDYVDSRLESFKGRITREDWVGSAKEEHFKKYGERI